MQKKGIFLYVPVLILDPSAIIYFFMALINLLKGPDSITALSASLQHTIERDSSFRQHGHAGPDSIVNMPSQGQGACYGHLISCNGRCIAGLSALIRQLLPQVRRISEEDHLRIAWRIKLPEMQKLKLNLDCIGIIISKNDFCIEEILCLCTSYV